MKKYMNEKYDLRDIKIIISNFYFFLYKNIKNCKKLELFYINMLYILLVLNLNINS